MRGSTTSQTGHILSQIDRRGQSKRMDVAQVRRELKEAGIAATPAEVAARTGIYSNATQQSYHEKLNEIGRYAREEYGIKDMSKLTPEIITDFMRTQMELGVSLSYWSGFASACTKLDVALSRINGTAGGEIRAAVEELRSEAKAELSRFDRHDRAYSNPNALIEDLALSGKPLPHLVATLQRECGLRRVEACQIKESQLLPGNRLAYVAKGGQKMVAELRVETYQRLSDHVREHGSLHLDRDTYYNALKEACDQTGQQYEGSHGLRYVYAQERYAELRESGMSSLEALGQVSEEMSHHRIEITLRYLAGHDD